MARPHPMQFHPAAGPIVLCGALLIVAALGGGPAGARSWSPHGEIERGCADCHTASGWQEIVFDHDSTAFALENGHAEIACTTCHRLDDFTAAAPGCAGCHADRHQGALDADCSRCHQTAGWTPAIFSHDDAAFPLWGAHGALDCIQCHANEITYQFAAPAQDCYDCHATDFAATRVAVHFSAGPDCETCHTLDSWEGGHDPAWLEIRSGHHAVSCGRCHKRGPDYTSHTCVDCHRFPLDVPEHGGLDPEDAGCRACHPHELGDAD